MPTREWPGRKTLRLPGFDYARPGAYFVTLVTAGREDLLGAVVGGRVQLSGYGEIVAAEWQKTASIRREIELDVFIVMPNHLHGIVVIGGDVVVGAHGRAPLRPDLGRTRRSLGSLIAGFKSATTKRINQVRDAPRSPVWQRNYYEHVVRNDADLNRIREYIADNPAKWDEDPENPRQAYA